MNPRIHMPERVLPPGFTWHSVRIIHVMPDDTVDGWRVELSYRERVLVEVIHRNLEHARGIAVDAAAVILPSQFSEISNGKGGTR